MTENILEIKNLSKSFGENKVLNRIKLSLKKGSVLGLMGENGSGKSTMMKCLFGIYSKDEGQFFLDGKPVYFKSPKDALDNGVAMVHQELNQCLDRTVAENIFLGRYPERFHLVDEEKMFRDSEELFKSLDINISPATIMRNMSVSQRQMVEIARAVSCRAKVIVLDEPTSSLTEFEVQKLFSIIERLKKDGVSFIYISHKMDEIFAICNQISVLRDGSLVLEKNADQTNMDEIVTAMVGRELTKRFPPLDNEPGKLSLEVKNLSTKYAPILDDISFNVREGEILGLYGLVGAGRSELLETLFGLRTISTGSITFKGKRLHFSSIHEAMSCGFALVTEERKATGMFSNGSIRFNTVIANLRTYCNSNGLLSDQKMNNAAEREIQLMHTRCFSIQQPIASLSGGNQQKVIIGKWLERSPAVLLLDEPTRGIDVGAKYEIYQLIINMAKKGTVVLVASSEMPELLGITNRIAVMSNHRLAGIVNTNETNQEELLKLSAMYL